MIAVLVLGLVGAAFAWLAVGPLPSYDAEPIAIVVEPTAARLDRGRALVGTVCRPCHVDPASGRLAGRELVELPVELGTAFAGNITRSADAGIDGWTDGELALQLRTGIHGHSRAWVPPWMPAFPRAADEDIAAMLAFLRSDHPWVAADAKPSSASRPSLQVRLHGWLDWAPASYPGLPIDPPLRSDPEAYGRYLVDEVLQCNGCHGGGWDARARARDGASVGYLGGGIGLRDINGKDIPAANITSDVEHGIGGWSYAEFRRALVDGFGPDGDVVRWPMRRHHLLDENEIEAIYAYLAKVPPIDRGMPAAADYRIVGRRVDPGLHVFLSHGCHYCHGEHGAGIADLSRADTSFATDAEMIAFIRDPAATRPDTEMPAWRGEISDDDLAAVAVYVRTRAAEE